MQNDRNISYYAKFEILKYICTKPKVTIYFEDTDFDGNDGIEFLNIYHNDSLITSCGSNNDTCGDFKYCIGNYSLPYRLIAGVPSLSAWREGKIREYRQIVIFPYGQM